MPDTYRIELWKVETVETAPGYFRTVESFVKNVMIGRSLGDVCERLDEVMWQPKPGYRYKIVNEMVKIVNEMVNPPRNPGE